MNYNKIMTTPYRKISFSFNFYGEPAALLQNEKFQLQKQIEIC
jgi:hypothetical protein